MRSFLIVTCVMTKPLFNCPNCNALYHLIKAEAGPETIDREITCRICGAPLPGRDGSFVLKYFLFAESATARSTRTAGLPGATPLEPYIRSPAD